MNLKDIIRNIPDFPKPGVQYKDIESIVENPEAFTYVINQFANALESNSVDKILALDARGFLFGAALAHQQKIPLVLARKKGKLPGECVSQTYQLEYGEAEFELQKTAVSENEKVFIVDDVLATGGTAAAAVSLVEQLGGVVCLFGFVIELEALNGRAKLGDVEILTLVNF